MTKKILLLSLLAIALGMGQAFALNIIDIDFNDGVDRDGKSEGILRFRGSNGFEVFFTDDDSGSANGVEITNTNPGNIKVGSPTDFVLGSNDSGHTSGIIASFNQGATLVSFDDTDNDGTVKALFAFDENNNLIGQSPFKSQEPVVVDTSMTGGKKIFKVEFDTAPGTSGGANDGTVFTIDNFHAEADETDTAAPPGINSELLVPEPSSTILAILALVCGIFFQRRK